MARSRSHAAEMIESGMVEVAGIPTPKVASLVAAGDPIELAASSRFVGRGGEKLAAALEAFPVEVSGRRCLDAGASTGGFTDCLLQHGAARVVAVDVGKGQLDDRLARREEVEVVDRTNVRYLEPDDIGGPFDIVVGDLSFISLCTVAPAIRRLVEPTGDVIMLVKPQFEVGRSQVGKGGVVRDPDLHALALDRVAGCFEAEGLIPLGVIRSPLTGAKGNVEFLMWARPDAEPVELEYPL
jgi:23S rRNA (cytidine1920-2'-O)/16S rRNA (cytidine1409-2'-O)-methyltransferase